VHHKFEFLCLISYLISHLYYVTACAWVDFGRTGFGIYGGFGSGIMFVVNLHLCLIMHSQF